MCQYTTNRIRVYSRLASGAYHTWSSFKYFFQSIMNKRAAYVNAIFTRLP